MIARENQRLTFKAHKVMDDGDRGPWGLKSVFLRRIRLTRKQKEAAPLKESQYRVNPWLKQFDTGFAELVDPALDGPET
jgi:hypothetical protein